MYYRRVPILHLIVGHRGVGKTTFLARITTYYEQAGRPIITLDLDAQIAARSATPPHLLLGSNREATFRQLERDTLHAITGALPSPAHAPDVYIALGAGYDPGRDDDPRAALPPAWAPHARILWLRRDTDRDGRIFVNGSRPRLDPNLSPLDEYLARYPARQTRYGKWHDDVWIVPEGFTADAESSAASRVIANAEADFVLSMLASDPAAPACDPGGIVTLPPHTLERPALFTDWIARRLAWPRVRFELRDDLLTAPQIDLARTHIPPARIVYSFRRALPTQAELDALRASGMTCDVPLDLAAVDRPLTLDLRGCILSLHTRLADASIDATAQRLATCGAAQGAALLKLAVVTHDLTELAQGDAWAAAAPASRAYVPRTPDAQPVPRYAWYRLLSARRHAPLSYFREGDGTSPDQPTLCALLTAALVAPTPPPHFAAVLGDPVAHSHSPVTHADFFAARATPFVALPCTVADIQRGALSHLARLGLRYAAVTAPLKRDVAATVATEQPTVNTLYHSISAHRWAATNTDLEGLRALVQPLLTASPDGTRPRVAIWGGGGTLPTLRSVLPWAQPFSARTGQPRDTVPAAPAGDDACTDTPPADALAPADAFTPDVVLWAAGSRSATSGAPDPSAPTGPPPSFRPHTVYDLDYSERSAGRAFALSVGAHYISGAQMFRVQAAAQQCFWRACDADDSPADRLAVPLTPRKDTP